MGKIKNIQIGILLVATLFACNTGLNKEKDSVNPDNTLLKTSEDISGNVDYQNGLALITKTDCFTCHDINDTKIGPSYKAVASKYDGAGKETIDSLVNNIINGSTGVWGQVPMPPHPSLIKEDTKKIVKYILLLKD